MGSGLDVEVIETLEGLRGLQAQWNELALRAGSADLFGTSDWVLQWWESFAARGPEAAQVEASWGVFRAQRSSPYAVSIWRHGRLAGLLPLLRVVGRWRGVPLRVLMPPLNGHAPRTSLALESEAEPLAAAAVNALAARGGWDVWLLDGLPVGSALCAALLSALERCGLRASAALPRAYSVQTLAGSWNAYLDSRPQKLRQTLRKSAAVMERLGAGQVELHREPAAVGAAMQRLFEIDAASWKAGRGESFGREPALRAHYGALALRFARRGACQVWLLRVGGADAAGLLCLSHRRVLYLLKTSYREQFAEAAPGTFLIACALERAWEEGWQAVDFVSRMAFTERWTRDTLEFAPQTVFRNRALQPALHALERGLRGLGRARRGLQSWSAAQ